MSKNPYAILNISEDATYEQIKESYLHLSRNLHPDKQSSDNYLMAKEHFETIDKAYKSISSPLRRFVFKEFGLKGIWLVDEFPLEFKQFEENGNIDNKNVQKKIKHLIIYMLQQDHAMNETDKSKISTKTIIDMSKLLKQNKYFIVKRGFPNSFSYEMPLPDLYGCSNIFTISNDVNGFQKESNLQLNFAFTTMKRIRNDILLNTQTSFDSQHTFFEVNTDWIINNSTQLRFCPISMINGKIQKPKIGFDKIFYDISFSAVTDFQHINFDFSDLNNQSWLKNKSSKSLKIAIQKNAVLLVLKYEYNFSKNFKLILQPMMSSQQSEEQLMWNAAFNYGYKIKLNQQYKLELQSCIGSQNYFQISLYTPKFNVKLPLVSQGNFVKIQSLKIIVMLFTLVCVNGYKFILENTRLLRQKSFQNQYNRLSEQKLAINKAINQVSSLANERLQKEIKYNGLIVIKALVGGLQQLTKIKKSFEELKEPKGNTGQQLYEDFRQSLQKINERKTIQENIEDQSFQVTDIFRSLVKGGQITNKKMPSFHPLVNEDETLYLLAIYLNRGRPEIYFEKNQKVINAGGMAQIKAGYIKRIRTFLVECFF